MPHALLLCLAPRVVTILVKNQVGDLSGFSREELQLGVYNFHEKSSLRLRKEWEFALIGRLLHQLPILQRNGDRNCGCELVYASVRRENGGIDLDARPNN